MKLCDMKIPVPFQLSMDDIGWIEGRTPYWDGFQPTRTGIPRRHTLEDYKIINEIGRSINMKICGMFVLGDWDRKGILAKIPYSNKAGKAWTSSPYVNIEEEEEIRDYLNGMTLPAEGEKGWYLITVDGHSIGWGKLAGGMMKNHYPKGLRR